MQKFFTSFQSRNEIHEKRNYSQGKGFDVPLRVLSPLRVRPPLRCKQTYERSSYAEQHRTKTLIVVRMRFPLLWRRNHQVGAITIFGQPILLDGLRHWFLLLTSFLMPFTFLIGVNREQYSILARNLFLVERTLLRRFVVTELLTFYILFERVLMPLFLLVIVYGSRARRIRAAFQFFLYTVVFSLFLLVRCVWLQAYFGTTDWRVLSCQTFSGFQEGLLFLALFTRLAVKVPMMPLHLWLPEAHTEASTEGSVILAGVLLKLGTYGILRFLLPMFSWARAQRAPLAITLSILRVLRAALTCIRQADLKKLIAYSSVSHMGLVTLGLFRGNLSGQVGRTFLMLTHGIVSPALFLRVGLLYERFGTRILDVYGGVALRMPLFRIFWAISLFSNMAIPGTASFPAEFLILLGSFQEAKLVTSLRAIGMVLTAVYRVRLYTLVLGGGLKPHMTAAADLNRRESFLSVPFIILMLWRGMRPMSVLESLETILYFF